MLHTAAAILASEPTGDVSFWQDYMGVAFDPAHVLAEITFTILFDFVLLFLVWGVFFKKVVLPKIRRDIHKEIDAEHGYEHEGDDVDQPLVGQDTGHSAFAVFGERGDSDPDPQVQGDDFSTDSPLPIIGALDDGLEWPDVIVPGPQPHLTQYLRDAQVPPRVRQGVKGRIYRAPGEEGPLWKDAD